MKLVVNKCFGGFGLSTEAVLKYAELKGIQVFGYTDDLNEYKSWDQKKHVRVSASDKDPFITYWLTADIGDNPDTEALNKAPWLNERDIPRDDEHLVRAVELLGEASNGNCANLKIVEIPDGVDYEIDDYDGMESIHEKHRSW